MAEIFLAVGIVWGFWIVGFLGYAMSEIGL